MPIGVLAISPVLVILLVAVVILRPWDKDPQPEEVSPVSPQTTGPVYMPAEFQPQESLLLGGAQLAELHPDVLANIIKAASGSVNIQVLAGSPENRSLIENVLTEHGISPSAVNIVEVPIMTMWLRDFGPITLSDINGVRSLVDFHYRQRRGNDLDDAIPSHFAALIELNLTDSPMLAEGGDFLSNGRGFCILSTRVINRNSHFLAMDPDQTMTNFTALLGFESLSMVRPLIGESTGHADMFCTFLRPDLVVVGSYEPAVDPENSLQLDQVAAGLQDFPTVDGPLKVERLPMPDHNDGVWRTYTNVVFANGVLLVPIYPDYCPELDKTALEFYRRQLPNHKVVGIDASRLITMNGALRCITMNIPAGRALTPN